MKNLFFALILVSAFVSCVSTPENARTAFSADFSEVIGKEWDLTEVRVNGESAGFDRAALALEGFGEMFTIKFDEQMVSGTGAPNQYFAPYTYALDDQTINISGIRSTKMASFREPEKLKEHDFFAYLQNIYEWKKADENLELISKTQDNGEVILIFSPGTSVNAR